MLAVFLGSFAFFLGIRIGRVQGARREFEIGQERVCNALRQAELRRQAKSEAV